MKTKIHNKDFALSLAFITRLTATRNMACFIKNNQEILLDLADFGSYLVYRTQMT